MKKIILISFLIIFIIPLKCSKYGKSLDIILPADMRLEDIEAGWWIKKLGISYTNDYALDYNMSESLKSIGKIIDYYIIDDDISITKWWLLDDIIIEEHNFIQGDNLIRNFYYYYDKPGVLWEELIGERAKELKPNRKYETAVVIRSHRDRCRLLLGGYGQFCEYMYILPGG